MIFILMLFLKCLDYYLLLLLKLEGLWWYFYPQFYTTELHRIPPNSSLEELKTAWAKVNEIIYNLYKISWEPNECPFSHGGSCTTII
jgi:hypothetical protein